MRIRAGYQVSAVRLHGNDVVVEAVCGHRGGRPGTVISGLRNVIEFVVPAVEAPRIGDQFILDFEGAAKEAS